MSGVADSMSGVVNTILQGAKGSFNPFSKDANVFANPLRATANMFGLGKKGGDATPAGVVPITTPVMPAMDMTAISQASQDSVAAQIARQGRLSTIMSGTSKTDRLGG